MHGPLRRTLFAMATIDFTNSVFDGLSFADPALSGPITIADSGTVSNKSGGTGGSPNEDGLELWGGAYTVSILGTVATTSTLDAETAGLYVGKGEGASKITVGPSGTVSGKNFAINTLQAINLTNNGLIGGDQAIKIDSGIQTSVITNSGTIASLINLNAIEYHGAGNLTLTNKSQIIGDVSIFDGTSIVSNTGSIDGDFVGFDNADKFTNKGILQGDLMTGKGNDTVVNSGVIVTSIIDLGDGNDSFTNTGKIINSMSGLPVSVSMGAGDDIFKGSAGTDVVGDFDGKDIYTLGDGADQFYAVKAAGVADDGLLDVIDGGAHKGAYPLADQHGDAYFAANALGALTINLDTAQFFDSLSLITLQASKAFGSEVGNDTIKNFETVYAGAGNDIIVGNGSANGLYGGAGNDNLYGGKGNDAVSGEGDDDNIIGGLGRDQLEGGAGADRFIYNALNESTLAYAGRDLILGFDDTADIIDLSALGLAASIWLGEDAAFSGVAGQYRILTTGFGWTFQIDTNADKKADMAIDIVNFGGAVTWDIADFAF